MSQSLDSLHPNQRIILHALQSATRILGAQKNLAIVGSVGKYLAGKIDYLGDLDVVIDEVICRQYWGFLEILSFHGLHSVYDVLDRPAYAWRPCRNTLAHAKALTLDCSANGLNHICPGLGLKHVNLDIIMSVSSFNSIPHASRWVRAIEPNWLRDRNAQERDAATAADHQCFRDEIKQAEEIIMQEAVHAELGLRYAWETTKSASTTGS